MKWYKYLILSVILTVCIVPLKHWAANSLRESDEQEKKCIESGCECYCHKL